MNVRILNAEAQKAHMRALNINFSLEAVAQTHVSKPGVNAALELPDYETFPKHQRFPGERSIPGKLDGWFLHFLCFSSEK